ncbi:S-adenosyl-L-methionine-dependent methyltransferase [Auricularia subglabra TFB-10046 SS5]|nr:S-adenosyl-L-methionine-dependent methyltransferase [Auricularia subglabra TFB-10046 SS5]
MSSNAHLDHHGLHMHDHHHHHEHQHAFNELDPSAPDMPTHPKALEIATGVVNAVVSATELDKEKTTVLDFACGSGHISRQLLPHVASIVGVDINDTGVNNYNHYAVQHHVENKMRALALNVTEDVGELRGAQFDAAICANAFHHLENPAQITEILASFLRPKGTLLVFDVAHDSPSKPPAESPLSDTVGGAVHHTHGFSPEHMRAMFAGAGLAHFESRDVGTFEIRPGEHWKLFMAKGVKQ